MSQNLKKKIKSRSQEAALWRAYRQTDGWTDEQIDRQSYVTKPNKFRKS